MKYWILTTEYPPQFGGGIGTYCYQWCRQLFKEKVEVTVFLVNKNVSGYNENWVDGIRLIEFSPYFEDSSSYLGYDAMISMSFERIVGLFIKKESAPWWIESQEYNGIAYYLLQKKHLGYAAYRDVNILINCHCPSFVALEYNYVSPYQLPYYWISEMEKFCIKAANICISPSQYLVDILEEKEPGLARQFVILKNPLETEDNNLPASSGNVKDEAIFIGKLSPIKGILELLRAFANLWDQGYEYRLKLVGDESYYYHAVGSMMGPYIRKKYQKYIQKELLIIVGSIKPEGLTNCVNTAKFIVLPSKFDNFPYAALEMMARRKLVLTSDSGGQKEILRDNENGLLYQSGVSGDLEKKILYAFSLPEETIKVMGDKAAEAVKLLCDPAEYFHKKRRVLQEYKVAASDHMHFPFLRIRQEGSENKATGQQQQKNLLSVVIPFYNMGDYVNETVNSIKASDYKEIEIIIVDDGSTDPDSLAKLEELNNQESIWIIRKPNAGLAAARNTGALQAKGEFLAFLDADDKVENTYYSAAINVFKQKSNVHFIGAWTQYFGEATSRWPAFTPEPPYLLFHNMVNSSSLIFRRESFVHHGLNDKRFLFGMEDYDSVINLVKNGMGGVVIPEFAFLYRVRKDSMARNFNTSNMTYLYQQLAEKHKLFYTTFAAEIANLLNANGPGYKYENPTLDYHLYAGGSFQSAVIRKLIFKIKRHPQLRKIALKIYKKLK